MSQTGRSDEDHRAEAGDWEANIEMAMQRAADQHQASTPAPRRISNGAFLALLLIPFAAVVSWNVWDLSRPVPPLETQAQEASLAGVMYVLSQQLEGHRAERGVYPTSLDQVSPPLVGIVYRLEGEGYVLEGRANDVEMTYGSWEDAGRLLVTTGSPVLEAMNR